MAHPHKKFAHKNDPSWLRGLEKYVEKASSLEERAVNRNYHVDDKVTREAGYDIDEEKK